MILLRYRSRLQIQRDRRIKGITGKALKYRISLDEEENQLIQEGKSENPGAEWTSGAVYKWLRRFHFPVFHLATLACDPQEGISTKCRLRCLGIKSLMKIKLLMRYDPEQFPFERLKSDYDIFAVRGLRGIPENLSQDLRLCERKHGHWWASEPAVLAVSAEPEQELFFDVAGTIVFW